MKRNPYFDNVRVILIFLVVFGHMIQPFIDQAGLNTIYYWIYTFHMPAFILISGFFAKGSSDKEYLAKLVKKLLLPYLAFQIIYTGYYYWIEKPDWNVGLLYPQWSLWFLVSLFCWHLLLIPFKRLKPGLGISLSFAIGITIGYFSEIGHLFSLSRTFVFFPFFLAGYWMTESNLANLKKKSVKVMSVVVMILVGFMISFGPSLDIGWLLGSKPYAELGVNWSGGWIRLILYFVSFVMTMSLLSLVPKQHVKGFTYIGTRTLPIYLLHGFFIQYFRKMNLFSANNGIDIFILLVTTIGIVYLLSVVGERVKVKVQYKRLSYKD